LIFDLEQIEPPARLDADICIAGAGAAGITLALQLVERGRAVVLLEGGGRELEERSQEIYQGAILGRPYFDLDASRLRFFGGTTNHWGGMCAPLRPLDFETRSWVPGSGWPIGAADLEPFSAAAHDILDLGDPDYDPAAHSAPDGLHPDLDPARLVPRLFRLSPPTRFAAKYDEALEGAENVALYLHAGVVDVVLSDDRRATLALVVAGPGARRMEVRARHFVLALGGIENARCLLNADRQVPGGVGNQHDLVGRFFCEHPNKLAASIVTNQGEEILGAHRALKTGRGRVVHSIGLPESVQEQEQTLNLTMTLHRARDSDLSSGYLALRKVMRELERGTYGDLGGHLLAVLGDLDGAAVDAYRQYNGTLETEIGVFVRCEQAPNPDSRVELIADTDRLGLRRVGLDWRLGALEKHTMEVATRLLAEEVGRLGLGRARVDDWLSDGSPTIDVRILGGQHHMGTTRMAATPAQGVVDADCRVHGIENLYIAGSSVFPTVGYANPTLTIVQLALRLGDHLDRRLAGT
jgi:choline dehydrogenase-like flavoprotein